MILKEARMQATPINRFFLPTRIGHGSLEILCSKKNTITTTRAYTMTNKRKWLWMSLVCTALLTPTSLSAKAPTLSSQSQMKELRQAIDEGGFELEMSGSNKLFPDNRMMYTVSFQNTGLRASDENIDITSPVPPETVYLPNTANGEDCDILFSVDGGESWGAADALEVQDADGKWHTATAKDYTHIKWLYLPELRPAEVQQVSFQVQMR